MMQPETFRLLILTESQNTAEQLISLFRNASHAVRGHRVTSEQDLVDHLDDQEWDVLICDHTSTHLSFTNALRHTLGKIPSISLIEQYDADHIIEGFEQGANDVIAIESEKHILYSAQREINNVRALRAGVNAKEQLEEATQRADQLLSDTQEAIAYVSDGMHIQANESYADIFGYDDADELEALPIIDLVADDDQEKFKAFLRHYSKHTDEQAELSFSGLKQDDSHFSALMILSPSSFEGEACTQILIKTSAQGGAAGSLTAGNQDLSTGLPNRYYLNEQIKTAYAQSNSGLGTACFMLLQLDDLEKLLFKYHIRGIDAIIKDCAEVVQPLLQSNDILTHFDYGCLGIITYMPPEEALKAAINLCKAVEDNICELESQTLLFTSSIGITAISQPEPETIIDEAHQAIIQLKKLEEKSTASVYLPAPEKSNDTANSESTLEEAIENERISLSYQPVISLRGDSREHYEVFVKFNDEESKAIDPYDTLSDIDDTKLDRWVILEATKALANHQAEGHECRLIINLSSLALADESLISWLAVAMKAANLRIDSVIWQFSERCISRNLNQAKETFEAITSLGGLVSISKFGRSGSDPLKTLKHVTTNFVKVDGDYIMSLQQSNSDPQVLKALISSINEQQAMSIVPEVENASILATLWQVGVNYIQGSYLQGPSNNMTYEFTEIT